MAQHGRRYLVTLNGTVMRSAGVLDRLVKLAGDNGTECVFFEGVTGEPSPDIIHSALQTALRNNCDAVLGLGGGSAIDTAKATAALITNGGPVTDYLEGVGTGRRLSVPPVPFIAVPTTSGTGAEVTKNAVISSVKDGYKKSFRHESLLAKVALVDPELTLSVPRQITAYTGMDALTQLIESYLSIKANPFTDSLALSGIEAAAEAVTAAYDNGSDIDARERMAYASLLSGICLANSGLGAVHGIAGGLGALTDMPHGKACAVLLPHVLRYNLPHCTQRCARVSRALLRSDIKDDTEAAKEGIRRIADINAHMRIEADLRHLAMNDAGIRALAAASMGSSMSGNPVPMTEQSTYEFLKGLC